MEKLPFLNSKICINITYTALNEQDHPNKNLSLPMLFPIPNDILINSNEKINSLSEALNKKLSIKSIISRSISNENKPNENKPNENNNNENSNNENNNNENNNNENNNEKNNENEKKMNEDINLNDINIITDNNMIIDEKEETKNILKTYNSVNTLNNIVKIKKDLIKYNIILRDYWDIILQKKSSSIYSNKHIIKYPIDDKELYSFPDLYGLEEKYFNKTEGVAYPYFNGKLFTRMINIYDFLLTFSSKLYLSKFT
jgi:hypothetical protein